MSLLNFHFYGVLLINMRVYFSRQGLLIKNVKLSHRVFLFRLKAYPPKPDLTRLSQAEFIDKEL